MIIEKDFQGFSQDSNVLSPFIITQSSDYEIKTILKLGNFYEMELEFSFSDDKFDDDDEFLIEILQSNY